MSREEALERPRAAAAPCGAIGRASSTLFVSVPPPGEHRTRSATPSRSSATAIAGCSSRGGRGWTGSCPFSDIATTVRRSSGGATLRSTGRRATSAGSCARSTSGSPTRAAAQAPATLALTLTLIALGLASRLLARSALLATRGADLSAALAISLALGASALRRSGRRHGRARARPRRLRSPCRGRSLGLPFVALLAALRLVLALSPETNSLMALGPHPGRRSRFYGVTNQVETLLLGPARSAALLLAAARLAALALLALVAVGASKTGADGGGILVFAAGFAVLGAPARTADPRAIPLALLGVVALRSGVRRHRRARRRVEPRDRRGLRRPRRALRHFRDRPASVSIATLRACGSSRSCRRHRRPRATSRRSSRASRSSTRSSSRSPSRSS